MDALYTRMDSSSVKNVAPLKVKTNKMVKRTVDIVVSSIVLIVLFPWVYVFVAISIKTYMPGPIFFRQRRTRKNGRIFICYKFRTMDARNRSDVFVDPEMNHYSLGNFLRTTSIDELPQFWNVLRGDMSVIGPRPHMLVHDEEYSSAIPEYPMRYAIKPGITGWAQVNGLRGERDLKRVKMRINYDLWYIQNLSLMLDIKIMFRTVVVRMKKQ